MYSELLRATPSGYSKLLKLSELKQTSQASRTTPSYSESGAPKNSELLQANPSYSAHSEQRLGLQNCKLF